MDHICSDIVVSRYQLTYSLAASERALSGRVRSEVMRKAPSLEF